LYKNGLQHYFNAQSKASISSYREAWAKRRLHLGCQAAEVLLELAGIAYAHDLEAGVFTQAEEQKRLHPGGWRRLRGA